MSATVGAHVLVPVFGGDISDATLARARAALDAPGTRVAIVHVVPAEEPSPEEGTHAGPAAAMPHDGDIPRWQQLADAAPAFVDTVRGEPAAVVLAQARRFASDVVLLGRPGATTSRDGWERDVVAPVRRGAPARLRVLGDRAPGRTGHARLRRRARHEEGSC